MTDPEKLTALKKAYADTILNTAKEAAARVVVSERNARGYQQELVAVRDEALRTLLRLKQMFNSKVKEAEIISLRQQNKIEELEAQLGEAEDIVGELRMELRELQDELERETNSQTYPNNKENPCWDEADRLLREDCSSHERTEAIGSCVPVRGSEAVVPNGIKNPSLSGMKNIHLCSCKDNGDGSHYTLPSILTRRRDAEMSRDESNQVIHTIEQSIAYGDMSATAELHDAEDNGPSSKSSSSQREETSLTSECAIASDYPSSFYNNIRDGQDNQVSQNAAFHKGSSTLMSVKTFLSAQQNDRKSLIVKPDSGEEKGNNENMELSTSLLCEESPVSASDKRFIKYTFKRKRKKDSRSSPDGDSSLDESGNEKSQKTGEKDSSYLEPLKSSLIAESSRDSLRVAQVARQLLPPSEKEGLLQNKSDDSLSHK